MYFSKVSLQQYDLDAQQLATQVCRDSYRSHQILWRLFGTPEQKTREFLFRQDDSQSWPTYFVLSQRPPDDSIALWNVQSKQYAPQLQHGQSLAFSLRANAIVSRKNDAGKSVRHDVVMDLKKRSGYQKQPANERPPMGWLAQTAGIEWLQRRSEANGFEIEADQVRVDGYRRHRSYQARTKTPIEFSSLDFDGILNITDPERFQNALFNGIGPAKGFGCGLLLVRRI